MLTDTPQGHQTAGQVHDQAAAGVSPDLLDTATMQLYAIADMAEEIGDVEMAELALLSIVKLRRTARRRGDI